MYTDAMSPLAPFPAFHLRKQWKVRVWAAWNDAMDFTFAKQWNQTEEETQSPVY